MTYQRILTPFWECLFLTPFVEFFTVNCTLARITGIKAALSFPGTWLAIAAMAVAQDRPYPAASDRPGGIAASKAEILFLTSLWKGERYPDGRPKVSDDLLKRMKAVSIEEAWDVVRLDGYENQFAGGWQMLHPDRPFVGARILVPEVIHLLFGQGLVEFLGAFQARVL